MLNIYPSYLIMSSSNAELKDFIGMISFILSYYAFNILLLEQPYTGSLNRMVKNTDFEPKRFGLNPGSASF